MVIMLMAMVMVMVTVMAITTNTNTLSIVSVAQVLEGQVVSLEQGLEEVLQSGKKKAIRSHSVDFAAVAELLVFLCSIFNDHSDSRPSVELSHEFLLKLSCKRALARGIQEFGIIFNCRSSSSSLEEALLSAHSAALRLYVRTGAPAVFLCNNLNMYDRKTEGNAFASDFRDALRTDIMKHGCEIRFREGTLVSNTTRSKFVSGAWLRLIVWFKSLMLLQRGPPWPSLTGMLRSRRRS